MEKLNKFLQMVSDRQDLVFAVFFVLVIAMLVLPLPTALIDALLAINLTLSLIVLITATYLKHALDISTFPSIILVTTIFRVALSVSTTRLILAQGDAGHLIQAFGQFVISGNIVVGLVIFLVIAIVQFMVITKGAERIAEVSARFTLDALPGKQMSIDNDLRSGDITKDDARKRRGTLEKESQFHGAMDGAMRFVKGDAIASLIIVFVNLLGGLTIGMMQRGLSFGDAGRLYVLLSVGDGLIAQIPSMFIAIAAGTIVTRITTDESTNLGRDITKQLGAEPKALGVSGAVALGMGFIPGFPTLVFLTLGTVLCAAAYWMLRNEKKRAVQAAELEMIKQKAEEAEKQPEVEEPTLRMAEMGDVFIVVGNEELLNLLKPDEAYNYLIKYKKKFISQAGYAPGPSGFVFDEKVPLGNFIVKLDNVPVFEDTIKNVYPNTPLTDDQAETYAKMTYDVRMRHADQLFGIPEATGWFVDVEKSTGRLATDVQQILPFMTIVDSLRLLLQDGIGLNPPRLVLEGLVQASQRTQEPEMIVEILRSYLRRQICNGVADDTKTIDALIVGPDVDAALRQYVSFDQGPSTISVNDEITQSFIDEARQLVAQNGGGSVFDENAKKIVVMTTADTRRAARKLLWQNEIEVPVLSYSDIAAEYQVRTIGVLSGQMAQAA